MGKSAGRAPATGGEIAEFQGLYGAYHISEILLQKIWLRREFDLDRARTGDGQSIEIVHPGQWNRLSGPDFRNARLRFGDRIATGAVEIHFQAGAWFEHGHHRDRAYDDVILHVVLFAPEADAVPTRCSNGRLVPVMPLLDLLWHDLEEYAQEDAIEAMSGRSPWPLVERLLELDEKQRRAELDKAAEQRWQEKLRFARLRVDRLGWNEACHQTALEILGYRSNRAPMLRVAARHPWERWTRDPVDGETLLAAGGDGWTLRGVRPANHPKRRLEQYAALMERRARWPEALRDWSPPAARRSVLRSALASTIFADAFGGTRLDTLIANLVFPFRATCGDAGSWEKLWREWYPGDVPDGLRASVRQLASGSGRAGPTNGELQAMLALQLRATANPGKGG